MQPASAVGRGGGSPPPDKPLGGPTGAAPASAVPAKAPVAKPSAAAFKSAQKALAGPSGDDTGTSPSEVAASAPAAAKSVRKGGSASAPAQQFGSAPAVPWVGSAAAAPVSGVAKPSASLAEQHDVLLRTARGLIGELSHIKHPLAQQDSQSLNKLQSQLTSYIQAGNVRKVQAVSQRLSQLVETVQVKLVGSSDAAVASDGKSSVPDGKESGVVSVASGFVAQLKIPADVSFLTGKQKAILENLNTALSLLDAYCQKGLPGSRALASEDLTAIINGINLSLRTKNMGKLNGHFMVVGHIKEIFIAKELEKSGETISEFRHKIPPTEVDVVSSTPDGQAVYNQIKSGRAGAVADLTQGKGLELVTQFDRTVTAAIADGVPNVRLIGPLLSPAVQQHVTDLQAAITATDTALRAGGPEPAKPANLSQELFDALKANIAAGKPLNISLSCLILG